MKNVVERADKDKNKEVSIEEILTFDDFEFIESALPVVLMMINPGGSLYYLVKLKMIQPLVKCNNKFSLQRDHFCFLGEPGMWEASLATL